MRLLWRFGVFIVLFGFLGGWLLRRTAGPDRLPELLLLSFLPWLLHLGYALVYAAQRLGGVTLGLALTGLASVAVAAILLRFSSRVYRSNLKLAAAVPLTLTFVHLALLGLYQSLARVQGPIFGTLGNLYLVAAALFVGAALLGYTWSAGSALARRR